MKRNPRASVRIDAVALSACVGLTALVYLAAIRPTLGSQARASENYQQYQARSQQADDLARKAAELDKSLVDLRKRLESSRVKLRKITEINAALDELTNLARSHKIEIDQISSGETQQGAALAMASIKLAAAGAFTDVVAFLTDVEQAHPEISATRFAIEAVRDPEGATTANAPNTGSRTHLTMNLEWYAEPVAPGGKQPSKNAGTPPR